MLMLFNIQLYFFIKKKEKNLIKILQDKNF